MRSYLMRHCINPANTAMEFDKLWIIDRKNEVAATFRVANNGCVVEIISELRALFVCAQLP